MLNGFFPNAQTRGYQGGSVPNQAQRRSFTPPVRPGRDIYGYRRRGRTLREYVDGVDRKSPWYDPRPIRPVPKNRDITPVKRPPRGKARLPGSRSAAAAAVAAAAAAAYAYWRWSSPSSPAGGGGATAISWPAGWNLAWQSTPAQPKSQTVVDNYEFDPNYPLAKWGGEVRNNPPNEPIPNDTNLTGFTTDIPGRWDELFYPVPDPSLIGEPVVIEERWRAKSDHDVGIYYRHAGFEWVGEENSPGGSLGGPLVELPFVDIDPYWDIPQLRGPQVALDIRAMPGRIRDAVEEIVPDAHTVGEPIVEPPPPLWEIVIEISPNAASATVGATTHGYEPPKAGEKEKKTRSNFAKAFQMIGDRLGTGGNKVKRGLDAATEVLDWIDAVYFAFDDEVLATSDASNPWEKAQFIVENFELLDPGEVAKNIVLMEIQDRLIGTAAKGAKKTLRDYGSDPTFFGPGL